MRGTATDREGLSDFAGGRGGDGVRRADEEAELTKSSKSALVSPVLKRDLSEPKLVSSTELPLWCDLKLLEDDEEKNDAKSSLNGSDERG